MEKKYGQKDLQKIYSDKLLKNQDISLMNTGNGCRKFFFSLIKFSLKTTQPNVLAWSHSSPQAICHQGGPEPSHGLHVAPSPTISTICAPAVGGQDLFLLPVSSSPKLKQHDLNQQQLTRSDMLWDCRWEMMQRSFLIYYLCKSKAAFKM